MNNLLPILKHRQEFDAQKERGLFVEELFGNEHSPIIMYGVDKGEFMEYSPSSGEDENTKNQAIANLEDLNVPYEIQEIEGFKIVLCQHEYAAEKILDKLFIKKIASELETNSVVAGIPMKGFMAIVAKGKGEANLYGAVENQYKNAQTYPISNSLFYLVDGEIEMLGGNNQSGAVKDEDGILEVTGKNNEDGKLGFVAKVGHRSEDELANQIQTAFQNIILQGMKDSKNFNGKINFYISQEFNEKTESLTQRLQKMAQNISERGAVQIMGGLSGEEFKVKFFYGEDELIAETVDTEPVQLKDNKDEANPEREVSNSNNPAAKKKPWWQFW